MQPLTRSVFQRSTKFLVGVGVLAVAVAASAAFVHLPALTSGASPVVSNLPPLNDSAIEPLLALNRATEAVTARVMPAVVNIKVVARSQAPNGAMDPNQIPAPFQQFFFGGPFGMRQMRPQPQVEEFEGTGVIISPDGYIVTNNHVVNGATSVQVTLNDKREFNAKVVGTDKATDLAVVKINASGLTSAAFGDSSQVRPGETVLAIGDPLGMDFSVTRGIVSAVNRSRNLSDGPNARGAFIQTDAPINHGNSGGPLVDAYGDVIGINTEILSSTGASDGIGFAIPSDLVKPTAAELIKNGKVERGYLGIEVTDVTPDVAQSLHEPGTQGALVDQVNAGSPAEQAGVKPYDVVTNFDGHAITSGSDLQTLAGGVAPGTVAHLGIMRDGKPLSLAVTLGNYDTASSAAPVAADATGAGANATPRLGITAVPLTPDLRSQLQIPDSVNGVVVESVTPGSPAMLAGIGNGDVIEQVNQHPVSTVGQLQQQLRLNGAGKPALLMVHNANGDFILPVHPQAAPQQ